MNWDMEIHGVEHEINKLFVKNVYINIYARLLRIMKLLFKSPIYAIFKKNIFMYVKTCFIHQKKQDSVP